jgi:translation initiation factor 3 subunit C
MSRFFHAGDSDSSSSDEEEFDINEEEKSEEETSEESSEEDSDSDDDSSDSDNDGKTGAARFLVAASDSEDSDDEDKVKVVKSAKDKRFDELEATIKLMENAGRISDWSVINEQYDKMNRQVPVLMRNLDGKPPKVFVKAIAELETSVAEAFEKQKVTPKKMNPIAQKGLNALRQKIKKNNREFQSDITSFRENPDQFMKEEAEEVVVPTAKKVKPTKLVVDPAQIEDGDDGFTMVGAGGKAMVYTPESILKHLRSIVESRGRKNTDRLEQIKIMEKLIDVSISDYQRIRVLLTLIATRFDLTSGSRRSPVSWRSSRTTRRLWSPRLLRSGRMTRSFPPSPLVRSSRFLVAFLLSSSVSMMSLPACSSTLTLTLLSTSRG